MNPSITQWLNKYPDSTREEMRAIRRDWINHLLQKGVKYTPMITYHRITKSGRKVRIEAKSYAIALIILSKLP